MEDRQKSNLASGDEDSCDDVGRMGIRASDGSCQRRSYEVLVDVQVHQCLHACLQYFSHNLAYQKWFILFLCFCYYYYTYFYWRLG